jgi:hypothetical protein
MYCASIYDDDVLDDVDEPLLAVLDPLLDVGAGCVTAIGACDW